MVKKILSTFLIIFILGILFPFPLFAQEDDISKNFSISAQVSYTVSESGNTRVRQTIVIENKSEFMYIPSYSVSIPSKGISNISVTVGSSQIPYTDENQNGRKIVSIEFPEKVVGVGKKNTFTFSYDSSGIAQKTGTVWRVYIPAVSQSTQFSSYDVTVDVPSSFGPASFVKPHIPLSQNTTHFVFSRSQLHNSGISITFGTTQIYNFELMYNLSNKNITPIRTEIALPPNTLYQDVYITELDPKPTNVYKDEDGNYLAQYTIPAKTSVAVKALVTVASYSQPQLTESSQQASSGHILQLPHWESNDPQIQKLAKTYDTPEKIYDYVVETLSYSKEKASGENKRLGAVGALKQPEYAVCLEFTDLFIAIARAAGIPARAVEGYAYTSDETDQPLSLFEDVLHSWPEYYDVNKKAWIMVDPTWGNTTRGVDYFHTFDFDHVAFAINGVDSAYPVPAGGYKSDQKTKDITVNFGTQEDIVPLKNENISVFFPSVSFSNQISGKITLENLGNHEIMDKTIQVQVKNGKSIEFSLHEIPPYGKKEISVSVPSQLSDFSFFNISRIITVSDNGKVLHSNTVYVLPFSFWYVIGGGAISAAIIISIIALKTGGLHFQKQK